MGGVPSTVRVPDKKNESPDDEGDGEDEAQVEPAPADRAAVLGMHVLTHGWTRVGWERGVGRGGSRSLPGPARRDHTRPARGLAHPDRNSRGSAA